MIRMHPLTRLLIALALSALGFAQSNTPLEKPALRLPSDIRPLKYEATLDVTPGDDSFAGNIVITISFSKPSADITLHAKEILFQSVTPAPLEIKKRENDLVTLHFAQPFPAGPQKLTIQYTGTLSRVLTDGAFQQQHAGDWYVFTKFEPITARRVFPCFDEPGFKVPWQLNLRVPKDLKAFSNTLISSEEALGPRKLVHFRETKPLPSYLVAFAVGPFDVIDTAPVGRNHVPSRIAVPKGRAAEAEYAASITPKLIDMLEGYFGSAYPYEKLDQVVVPLTTSWGAMENAGMIAYGDFFLAPKAQDSESRRQGLAIGMEHEMSHQWFGDLVTMQWWNDIWLNEAFASWVSNKLVAAWRPDWRIDERRAASAEIFKADSLTAARKIRQPIETAGDIGTAFDGITYGKGQDVIAMFEHYLGEATFQTGVRAYLKAHAFGNATSDDLFSALDKAAPNSGVGEAFGSFLNQGGYPVVSVSLDCAPQPRVQLTQQRMVPKGSTARENALWDVPVCLSWDTGSQCSLLKAPVQSIALPSKVCPAWVFADSGAAGYYATTYSHADAAKLVDAGLGSLSRTEKAAYLRNVRVLFASGVGDLEQELRTAATFSHNDDPNLVQEAAGMLESVADLVPADLKDTYAARIRELFDKQAIELGWRPKPADPPEIRRLRGELVPFVATDGSDVALFDEARKLADAWLKDRSSLEAETVPDVLFVAAWGGGRDLFKQMTEALRTTKIQRERRWIIGAMSGFRDPAIAASALQLIGGQGIDARETSALLFGAGTETRETVWQYVQANFDKLNAMLPSARGVPFAARLPEAATAFCDTAHADAAEAFFQARLADMPGGPRNLARAVERIRLCTAQAEVAKPAVAAFLRP
jgi:alanyl aminopeptidase